MRLRQAGEPRKLQVAFRNLARGHQLTTIFGERMAALYSEEMPAEIEADQQEGALASPPVANWWISDQPAEG